MQSPVYFASLRAYSDQESTTIKVQKLFDRAGFPGILRPRDKTILVSGGMTVTSVRSM
jgi:uncharacterized Fe-S center protein